MPHEKCKHYALQICTNQKEENQERGEGKGDKKESSCITHMYQVHTRNSNIICYTHVLIKSDF